MYKISSHTLFVLNALYLVKRIGITVVVFICVVEIFLIENQQSATDDRRGPCLYVDSKTDGALIKVTGCNDTDEKQNWAYTLKGQIMVSI